MLMNALRTFLLQVVIAGAGILCAWLVTVIAGDGCILNLSLFGYCIIDSLLMTVFGSAALSGAALLLWSFVWYFVGEPVFGPILDD